MLLCVYNLGTTLKQALKIKLAILKHVLHNYMHVAMYYVELVTNKGVT